MTECWLAAQEILYHAPWNGVSNFGEGFVMLVVT
jgi:hypothetical protein